MSQSHCPSCGEPVAPDAKFCASCGARIESKTPQKQRPAKRVNRTDEGIKDVFRSKTLKIYLTFIFVVFCVLPILCACLGVLGFGPMTNFINSLLGGV